MQESQFVFPNGDLPEQFNQSIDWFLNSERYTAGVPVKLYYPYWAHRHKLGQVFENHQPGDRYILDYCNEVYIYGGGNNDPGSTSSVDRIRNAQRLLEPYIEQYQIPREHFMFLGNVHEWQGEQTQFANQSGFGSKVLLIDYYELQTYFFHRYLGCDHSSQYNSQAPHDIKFMFGKTGKNERVILAHKLQSAGLLNNSISSCLVDPEHVTPVAETTSSMYNEWLKQSVSVSDIEQLLLSMAGSPDGAKFMYYVDPTGQPTNHCPGYPYDPSLFTDTRVSIVPETYYFKSQAKFITEKTYKAIYNHHPFVIMGPPGVLHSLQQRGYQTFGTLCDELYDLCPNDRRRLDMIVSASAQLIDSNQHHLLDEITKHNHAQLVRNAEATMQQLNHCIAKFLG
jgi:hypothetical protein